MNDFYQTLKQCSDTLDTLLLEKLKAFDPAENSVTDLKGLASTLKEAFAVKGELYGQEEHDTQITIDLGGAEDYCV